MHHLGDSEKIIWIVLKDEYRKRVRIATKLPTFLVRSSGDFDHYLKTSLERLQTDYIARTKMSLLSSPQPYDH